MRELETRLAAHPGVVDVTVAEQLPLMPGSLDLIEVEPAGAADTAGAREHLVGPAAASPDFFAAFGAPLLAGRLLDSRDLREGAGTVVVNEMFVRRVLDDQNPIGRRIRVSREEGESSRPEDAAPGPWLEIVGVVGDLVPDIDSPLAWDNPTRPYVYRALGPTLRGDAVYLAVHARGRPEALVPVLRRTAGALSPDLHLTEVQRLNDATSGDVRAWTLMARVILAASATALLLALAGIYSVMSFTVSRRTREIGVRVALGAGARRVVLEIFRRPLTIVALGVAVGSLLVGTAMVASSGAVTAGALALLLAYALVMMGVCALACVGPTLRALRVEPTVALGAEG